MAGLTRLVDNGLLTAAKWNGNIDALELLASGVIGQGIVSGLVISDDGDLDISISAGVMVGLKAASVAGGPYTLPDDDTRYIWIDEDNVISDSATAMNPGGNVVCLGKVVTASGSISAITTENRQAINVSVALVEAKTDAYELSPLESGKVLTNEGASARQDFDLPSCEAGLIYTFIVQDADGIRATAKAGDTIRIAASVSASGGRIDSTTVGSAVTLIGINATEWIATTSIGTWSVT